MEHLPTTEFLASSPQRVLIDVRSPGEYTHGHIPGARNIPLFTDAERAQVGTAYKQQGKEIALMLGLKLVGPKLESFVREARKLAPERQLAVHCWRGGQRSQSMAWLFRQGGFDVVTLNGGYKYYRRHILSAFEQQQLPLIVIGGQTGSGKTKVLHALQHLGEQIIDLEALAHHKGSAFGAIGEQPQPTVEQFENDLHQALGQLDPARPVWIENESRSIGRVFIPDGFWKQMKAAPLFNIEIPFSARIENLVQDYVGYSAQELEAAFLKIDQKLGGQNLRIALDALQANDYVTAAGVALRYYDKTYRFGLENNPSPDIRMLPFESGNPEQIAQACLQEQRAGKSGNPIPLEPRIITT
ncbi:MAG: tRNA 2-selenouridine(34) synthase MnmH [Saprospiraceae bacterium]|nr:tRNA 2-selenouridine(34) synthase MnmH [Saprospiraceae bacterium]